ncbi:hypothetical protein D3C86_1215270 [compost metagenome]
MGGIETQKLRQERHQQNGGDTENRGKGNRGGNIFRFGANGGCCGSNGGIAADGVAAGNQRRELGRQAQHSSGRVAHDQRQRDDQRNAADQQAACAFEDGKAQGCAKKRHRDFEQRLGAELYAGRSDGRQRHQRTQQRADQNGEHKIAKPCVARKPHLKALRQNGGAADRRADENSRQKRGKPAERKLKGMNEGAMLCHGQTMPQPPVLFYQIIWHILFDKIE